MTRDLFDNGSSDDSLDDGVSAALRRELATTSVPYDESVVDRMLQAATAAELQHVRTWHAPLAAAAAVVLVGGGAAAIAAHSGTDGRSSGGGPVCPPAPGYSGTVVPSFTDTPEPGYSDTAAGSTSSPTSSSSPSPSGAALSTSSTDTGSVSPTVSAPISTSPISTSPISTSPISTSPSPAAPSVSAPIPATASVSAPCAPPTAAPDATTSAAQATPIPPLSTLPNGAVGTPRAAPSSGQASGSTRTPITIDLTAQPGHRAVVDGPAIPRRYSLTVTDVQLIRRSGTDGTIELQRDTSEVLGDTLSNLLHNATSMTITPDEPLVFTPTQTERAVLTCAGTTTCTVRLVLRGTYLG